MIPLGILAAQGKPGPVDAFEFIASFTTVGGESEVTFSGIPQTYRHLQVIAHTRTQAGDRVFRINTDSSAVYETHRVRGNSSTVQAINSLAATSGFLRQSNTTVGNRRYPTILRLFNYRATNKTTLGLGLHNMADASSDCESIYTSLYNDSAAVTSVSIGAGGFGDVFFADEFLYLYGVK